MTPPSIAAVIVTFNRSKKLTQVLDALDQQTHPLDAIYVVDNASTDDTSDVLAARGNDRVHHIRLPENIGGAGGFYEGIKQAFQQGHDLFWISDDDAYPAPDAIQVLVTQMAAFDAQSDMPAGFACSNVKWTDGSLCEMNVPAPVWDWPRWYSQTTPVTMLRCCSFVSVLVPRWAIATYGLPIKDYFIWHDDIEYTLRISQTNPGIFCPNSIVVHDTPENKGANFGLVTEASLWKFKYGVRNEVSRRRRDMGWLGAAVFVYHVRAQMKLHAVAAPLRRALYRSVWDGMWFRPKVHNADGSPR